MSAAVFENSQAGAVYVFYGHSNVTGFGNVDLASFTSGATGFRVLGAAASDELAIVSVGDVNGDGTDDFLVSAYQADSLGRTNNGAA